MEKTGKLVSKDMSFVDRQGKIVYPNREDHYARKSAKVGKAYAFFDCRASKEEIEAELPTIRELVKTPSKLELSLTEGTDNIQADEKLTALAQEAKQAGLNYTLQATYPNATNKQTADEVAAILNQAYQSPLYKPEQKEPFRGAIVYQENNEYVFRD